MLYSIMVSITFIESLRSTYLPFVLHPHHCTPFRKPSIHEYSFGFTFKSQTSSNSNSGWIVFSLAFLPRTYTDSALALESP